MSAEMYVYILANKRNGTLYISVTNNLARRIYEHRTAPSGFVRRYGLYDLVYYTEFESKWYAVRRETSMKRWSRAMKIEYIEALNPDWSDLAGEWIYHDQYGEPLVLGMIRRVAPARGEKKEWYRR